MSIAVIAMAVLPLALSAVDLSGMWTMRLLTREGAEAPTIGITLKQNGEKLTGSCSLDDLDEILTLSGEAKDEAISVRCSSTEITMSFSGQVSGGDEMKGTWSTSAAAQGTFTATKRR
jgi:hypothetical protein